MPRRATSRPRAIRAARACASSARSASTRATPRSSSSSPKWCTVPAPLPLTTYQASQEEYQGWLAQITGTVTAKSPDNSAIWVDDGSGPVRVFVDGYNGSFDDIQLLDRVTVVSLVSEDGDGPRIRVRNHGAHPEYPDDVIVLDHNVTTTLTIAKAVEPAADLDLGDVATYTVTLSNDGDDEAVSIVLADELPEGVTFGGFVLANGAAYDAGTVTWSGSLASGASLTVVFTATVDVDSGLYGETVTNSAGFVALNAGSGADEASFTVIAAPELTIAKAVAPETDLDLGEVVVYTITLSHDGGGVAHGILLTDALPAGVTFGGFVQQSGAAHDAGTITWSGDMASGASLTVVFTATVDMNDALYGQTITNTVVFTAFGAGSGADEAAFTVTASRRIYLPLVMRAWRAP